MKKILFLLLVTISSYGQTYQNPTFGTVTTKTTPTVTTPAFIGTLETTGVNGKIPSTYIEKTENKATDFSTVNNTLYPSVQAVKNYVDESQNTNVAYVDINGDDFSAVLGSSKKSFLTIDAALDALPSTGGVVNIGLGTFASPTNSKIKDNISFIGSGKPFPNMIITYIDEFIKPSITSPTKLEGGTILTGTFDFSFKNNIQIRNLGIDVGKDWIDSNNGGVPLDGLFTAQLISHPDNNASPPTMGIVIENVSSLNYSATALSHSILVENTVDAKLSDISTYFGIHGLVIKSRGTNIVNVESYGHSGEGIILKSDSYAYSGEINLSNVYISSIGNYDGGGLMLDGGSGNLRNINISNLHTEFCTYGVTAPTGSIDKVNINNSTFYKTENNAFFIGSNVISSNISNVLIDGTISGNNLEVVTGVSGNSTISNVESINSSQNGIALNASSGAINAVNVVSKNNNTNVTLSGNVYGYSFESPTAFTGSLYFDPATTSDKISQIDTSGRIVKSAKSVSDFVLKSGDTMTGDLVTTGISLNKGQSDTLGAGSLILWGNGLPGTSVRNVLFQMNSANGLTYWMYNGSSWTDTGLRINEDGSISMVGVSTAPTAIVGTNTTQIATMAAVANALGGTTGYLLKKAGTGETENSSISESGGFVTVNSDAQFQGSVEFNDIVTFDNLALLKSYTVATLPTGAITGAIAYVTDGSSPTYRGTATGGGSEKCLVFYDGTVWRF